MCSVHFPSLPFSSLFSVFRVLVQCVWWCAVCCHVRCAVCGVLPCAVCSVWWWGCTLGRVSYTREGELSLLHLFPHFKQLVHSSDSTLPSSTMYQTGVSRYFALLCVSCFFCGVEPVSAAFVYYGASWCKMVCHGVRWCAWCGWFGVWCNLFTGNLLLRRMHFDTNRRILTHWNGSPPTSTPSHGKRPPTHPLCTWMNGKHMGLKNMLNSLPSAFSILIPVMCECLVLMRANLVCNHNWPQAGHLHHSAHTWTYYANLAKCTSLLKA